MQDGVQMSVAAAVAVLLLHFDGSEAATLRFRAHAAAPLPLSKEAVRARLRLLSECHPHAQPTRSQLQQVWLFSRGFEETSATARAS